MVVSWTLTESSRDLVSERAMLIGKYEKTIGDTVDIWVTEECSFFMFERVPPGNYYYNNITNWGGIEIPVSIR